MREVKLVLSPQLNPYSTSRVWTNSRYGFGFCLFVSCCYCSLNHRRCCVRMVHSVSPSWFSIQAQRSSHQLPLWLLGYSWPLASGWQGRISGDMGEGFSMKGSPPLGAACLGVLPAPPFLEGQTVLEGHDFWRQLETVSGCVCLQVSGILLRSQLLWGPLSSPREVPANPTE